MIALLDAPFCLQEHHSGVGLRAGGLFDDPFSQHLIYILLDGLMMGLRDLIGLLVMFLCLTRCFHLVFIEDVPQNCSLSSFSSWHWAGVRSSDRWTWTDSIGPAVDTGELARDGSNSTHRLINMIDFCVSNLAATGGSSLALPAP